MTFFGSPLSGFDESVAGHAARRAIEVLDAPLPATTTGPNRADQHVRQVDELLHQLTAYRALLGQRTAALWEHRAALLPADRDAEADEYVLRPSATHAWITVDTATVFLMRTDKGVWVELWPLGHEDGPSLRAFSVTKAEIESAVAPVECGESRG